MVQEVQCLPSKQEDLNSISRTHVKMPGMAEAGGPLGLAGQQV